MVDKFQERIRDNHKRRRAEPIEKLTSQRLLLYDRVRDTLQDTAAKILSWPKAGFWNDYYP